MTALGTAIVEWKLDGARIQVHRDGDRVAVFTRNLREITEEVPEVVASVLEFGATSFILDGEALLLGPGGLPQEFQDSVSRFGSDGSEGGPGLTAFYFDCLHLDGADLIDAALHQRRLASPRPCPPTPWSGR